jgi:VWFA-related protein
MGFTIKSLARVCGARVFFAVIFLGVMSAALCAQRAVPQGFSGGQQSAQEQGDRPQLKHRPAPQKPSKAEGKIHLDVVVKDASGKAIADLHQQDFTLLEDGRDREIASFESFDGFQAKADPPVEIVLLVDQMNLPFQQVAFVRSEIARFLSKNHGHLQQPVSIMVLSDAGLRMQLQPTVDGNAVLTLLNQMKTSAANVDPGQSNMTVSERFVLSVRGLSRIAQTEAKKPGRKLLIWMGPGWGVDEPYSSSGRRDQELLFNTIVDVTNRLRESRTVVYSVFRDWPGASIDGFNQMSDLNQTAEAFRYESLLKGVQTEKQARRGDLDLRVFAVHSGGGVLGPGDDLVAQIEGCIADADTFYRISFNPAPAAGMDEYHDLKIEISKPGLTAHTNAEYYNEPAWK